MNTRPRPARVLLPVMVGVAAAVTLAACGGASDSERSLVSQAYDGQSIEALEDLKVTIEAQITVGATPEVERKLRQQIEQIDAAIERKRSDS